MIWVKAFKFIYIGILINLCAFSGIDGKIGSSRPSSSGSRPSSSGSRPSSSVSRPSSSVSRPSSSGSTGGSHSYGSSGGSHSYGSSGGSHSYGSSGGTHSYGSGYGTGSHSNTNKKTATTVRPYHPPSIGFTQPPRAPIPPPTYRAPSNAGTYKYTTPKSIVKPHAPPPYAPPNPRIPPPVYTPSHHNVPPPVYTPPHHNVPPPAYVPPRYNAPPQVYVPPPGYLPRPQGPTVLIAPPVYVHRPNYPVQHGTYYNPNVHYVYPQPVIYSNKNSNINNVAAAIGGAYIYHKINSHSDWYQRRREERLQRYWDEEHRRQLSNPSGSGTYIDNNNNNHNINNDHNIFRPGSVVGNQPAIYKNETNTDPNTSKNSLSKLTAVVPFKVNDAATNNLDLTNRMMSDAEDKYKGDPQQEEIRKNIYSSVYLNNVLHPKNSEILKLNNTNSSSAINHFIPIYKNTSGYNITKLLNPTATDNQTSIVKQYTDPQVLPLTLLELDENDRLPDPAEYTTKKPIKHITRPTTEKAKIINRNSGDMIQVTNTLLFSILALFLIN